MAKIYLNELRRRIHEIETSYNGDIQVTIDKDGTIQPFTDPELAEETPEESEKRAERQERAAKAEAKRDEVEERKAR